MGQMGCGSHWRWVGRVVDVSFCLLMQLWLAAGVFREGPGVELRMSNLQSSNEGHVAHEIVIEIGRRTLSMFAFVHLSI